MPVAREFRGGDGGVHTYMAYYHADITTMATLCKYPTLNIEYDTESSSGVSYL